MKHSFCLAVFVLCLCLAMKLTLVSAAPSSSDAQMTLKRVARQMPPPPPPPEMPSGMPGMLEPSGMYQNIPGIAGATTRNRREAKGGGAMPTRKG